jgi:biopolymer transport protein ExbB
MAEALTRAVALIDQGGPVAWLLVAMSVLASGITLAKLWRFRTLGRGARCAAGALAAWRDGRVEAAWALARCDHPAAQGLSAVIEGRRRGLPEALIREEAARRAEGALDDLRTWFRPLEVIGSLAPLLGLFGTVLGMIDAFAALERAGAQVDPAILSGGIWVALLTTALGLAVAMPTVAALSFLERQVERAERRTDDLLAAAFTGALAEPARDAAIEPVHGRRLAPA